MRKRLILALAVGMLIAAMTPGAVSAKKPHPGAPPIDIDAILRDPHGGVFDLRDGKSAASQIVGHQTISEPGFRPAPPTGIPHTEKPGVVNNIFTPDTHDRWPTVFYVLENHVRHDRAGSWLVDLPNKPKERR